MYTVIFYAGGGRMKNKIYNFILVFISVIMFSSFSFAYLKNNDNKSIDVNKENNFELIVFTNISTTDTKDYQTTVKTRQIVSEILKYDKIVSDINTVTTVTKITTSDLNSGLQEISFPIDINTADIEELMTLDGIGEVTASAIINYRELNGNFHNRDELMNVSGIGEAKLAKIYDFIFVENEIYDYYTDDEYSTEENNDEISDLTVEYSEQSQEEYNIDSEESYQSDNENNLLSNPINLNMASKDDLMKIPNMTDEIAEDILSLRDEIGSFSHTYELLMIDSISDKTLAEMIKYLEV